MTSYSSAARPMGWWPTAPTTLLRRSSPYRNWPHTSRLPASRPPLPASPPLGHRVPGIIAYLVEAIRTARARRGELTEVGDGGARPETHGQSRGVRSHDQVLRQAALQSQARYAERLVLVIEGYVEGAKGRLGNPPGHAHLLAVLDLPGHRRLAAFFKERVRVAAEQQLRH